MIEKHHFQNLHAQLLQNAINVTALSNWIVKDSDEERELKSVYSHNWLTKLLRIKPPQPKIKKVRKTLYSCILEINGIYNLRVEILDDQATPIILDERKGLFFNVAEEIIEPIPDTLRVSLILNAIKNEVIRLKPQIAKITK